MFSRIDKLLREQAGTASIAQAHALRVRDIELVIGKHAPLTLVRPAVALALRCFAGDVVLQPVPGAPEAAVDAGHYEGVAYGTPERVRTGTPANGALRLALSTRADATVSADASGWCAAVNLFFDTAREPAVAPAGAFAAAAAFGKMFAAILGANREIVEERWSWSLFSFGDGICAVPIAAPLELGAVTLLGAGAIGSSFAYVLHLSDWLAKLRIIDSERYDEPNHETTLLIARDDAYRLAWKPDTLARHVERPGLTAEPVRARITRDHPELHLGCAAFVCGVDNAETRLVLDDVQAGVLLNAGVGYRPEDAGHVLWTRHAKEDAQLASLYAAGDAPPAAAPPDARPPSEVAADECSRLAYDGVSMAAPFLGLAAGSMLAAGVAQHAMNARVDANYVKLDLLALQSKFLRVVRRR